MSEKKPGAQTVVRQVEADLSMFDLPGVGSNNIMTADPGGKKEPAKLNIFSKTGPDMTIFDNKGGDPDPDPADPADPDPDPADPADPDPDPADPADPADPDPADPDPLKLDKGGDPDPNNGGRPKVDKNGLLEFTKKMIEAKQIVPFDDEKPLEKYSLQDYEELFQANFEDQKTQMRETVTKEFWESLPEEIQFAGNYLANGGQDLKGLFQALAAVEQTRELSADDEGDQEVIAREYLRATQFGNDDEINEEITSWKDLGKLGQKAKQFKPKLDKMKEDRVALQLSQQEVIKKKQQDAAKNYMKSVYDVLEPGTLNGMKLDKKTQGMLYSGLVQTGYPSISGRQTNMLGHLLEKYQFVEPDHSRIAEVLWLLHDPEGYKDQLRKAGAADNTKKTIKLLKTEEGRKVTNTADVDDDDNKGDKRKLTRPVNVFSGKRT